jgi:hypothetical protein
MPNKEYSLVGLNGNVFVIMAYVRNAMKDCKFSKDDINLYISDATSGDYNHALAVSQDWIDKCNEKVEVNHEG